MIAVDGPRQARRRRRARLDKAAVWLIRGFVVAAVCLFVVACWWADLTLGVASLALFLALLRLAD